MKRVWTKHPRRDETALAYRRHWILKGTDGRVIERRSKYGVPTCFYAVAPLARRISRHRSKQAATRAVERFIQQQERMTARHARPVS